MIYFNPLETALATTDFKHLSISLFDKKLQVFVSIDGVVGVVELLQGFDVLLVHGQDVLGRGVRGLRDRHRLPDDDRDRFPVRHDAVVVLEDPAAEEHDRGEAPEAFDELLEPSKFGS